MNLNYFVGGVNGVGKSTLLDAIAKKSSNFRVVKGSEELMRWLGIPGDYDALRALPREKKRVEWVKCLEKLLDDHYGHDLLVDAHYLNMIDGVVTEVVGEWIAWFDAAVLVTAPPAEILKRIEGDRARERGLFRSDESDKLGVLEAYQQQTRAEFCRITEGDLWDLIPNVVISHRQDKTSEAVDQFLKFDAQLRQDLAAV
ncbi:MAG TPA: ATP-binding protein [Candidatus Saccharimonadales bacterium]|nr:ATP-binding protein [Candidatus Saccharimonadales bacterium]